MPWYEYECPKCGVFEIQQRMADDPISLHDVCGSPVERRISRTAFSLKGDGWYADGYGAKSKNTEGGAPACKPEGCTKADCPAATSTSTSTEKNGA